MKAIFQSDQNKIVRGTMLLITIFIFCTCAKDEDTAEQLIENLPPLVNAGPDQVIILPESSVFLDGSSSKDPDGVIKTWNWTKLISPGSSVISEPTTSRTIVSGLEEGTHIFSLRVTDNSGQSAIDNVTVSVKPYPLPDFEWQLAIGGSLIDIGQSIQPALDGGYILVGNTNSPNGDITGYHESTFGCYESCFSQTICDYYPDGLMIKMNNAGAIEWQKALGGSGADNLLSVQATEDGGYIASGLTYSNDGDVSGFHGGNEADAWVVKVNSSGEVQWQKVLGGATGCDFGNAVLSTDDGGYIVAGHTDSEDGDVTSLKGERDMWLIKLSDKGELLWQKTLGGSGSDYIYALQNTPDGGYIAAGYTFSMDGDVSGNHGDADAWVIKLNSGGNIQWQKTLGGSLEEIGRSIQPTEDGGYILAGSTKSMDGDISGHQGNTDAWVVKLSKEGNIQWQRSLGGTYEDIGRSVQPTNDGGYIITGSTISNNGDVKGNHGGQDIWVVKLDGDGKLVWQKTLGGEGNDFANSVLFNTIDNSYVLAGQTSSFDQDVSGNHGLTDVWVVKLKE